MADQHGSPVLFGLDDSDLDVSPSFLDNNPPSDDQQQKDHLPTTTANKTPPLFASANWDFQTTPSFDPPTDPIFQANPWDFTDSRSLPSEGTNPLADTPGIDPSASVITNPLLNPSGGSSSTLSATRRAGQQQQQQQQQQDQSLAAELQAINILNMPNVTIGSLTPAQQEALCKIAMPSHIQLRTGAAGEKSPKSPSSDTKRGGASSPEQGPASARSSGGGRKRKTSDDADEDEDEDDDEQQPVKKTAHNMIEKRYRTNLNDKIAALRDSVPSLRIMSKSARGEDTTEDREELHGLTPAHKLNKATVLSKATEYIRHLEKRNNRLIDENAQMQQRIAAFEKLFMAGAMNGAIGPMPQAIPQMQYPQDAQQFMSAPPGSEASPAGMIKVPEDMKRILLEAEKAQSQPYPVPQQPYPGTPALIRQQQVQRQQQQQQQQNRSENGRTPFIGKLMVGSLAGLMVLEAVRENEQSNETPEGRGLAGLPLHWLASLFAGTHVNIMGHSLASSKLLLSLKLLFLLGSLLWVFVPWVFAPSDADDGPSKTQQARAPLEKAPSPASPIAARREAWLASTQTLWIPCRNVCFESAVMMLNVARLVLLTLVGSRSYLLLTGTSDEQEAARVKAWSIALDAQLAGGDPDISTSRLTLTLLASGTLPDTPLRLMMKALHIRILLWDLGTGRGFRLRFIDDLAVRLARARWDEARRLHRAARAQDEQGATRQTEATANDGDELPRHLALLLEQDCHDILNNSVIQRAQNLARNRPTIYQASDTADGMDFVVHDTSIRSPMDAIAAWWSCQTLKCALSDSLRRDVAPDPSTNDDRECVGEMLDLALGVAPVGSDAHTRALVAKALLVDEHRGATIAEAVQAIGLSHAESPEEPWDCGANSPSADVKTALQHALAIAHLDRRKNSEPVTGDVPGIALATGISADMSLLGYVAAFELMERLFDDTPYETTSLSSTLEHLAGSLRIWAGSSGAEKSGLDQDIQHGIVERCLAITRSVVGMEVDTGYGSMSDDEPSC